MDTLKTYLALATDAIAPYPVVQAIIIAALFVLIAVVVDKMCSRVVAQFLTRMDRGTGNRIVELLHRPVFITVVLIGFVVASHRLDINPSLQGVFFGLVGTVLVFIWAVLGHRLFNVIFTTMVQDERRFTFAHPATAPMFRNSIALLMFVIGVYGILLTWNINVTGLMASAGIVGLALSFAAQDTLGNLFAGVSILADRPYEIGDYIILDSGERGAVTHIGLRSTRLFTRDDVGVTIPNGVIARAKIINEAANPLKQFRIGINVGVAYGSNIKQIIGVLTEIAVGHDEVCTSPDPRVRLRSFGEYSLDFELLAWINNPADRGRLKHELHCIIYESFQELEITIPFPRQDVNLNVAEA